MPANVVLQQIDNSGFAFININAGKYQRSITLPAGLENALLYVHFSFDSIRAASLAQVPNIPVTFDGVPMTKSIGVITASEVRLGGGVAYRMIGDGSAIADPTLVIDFGANLVVPTAPSAMRVRVQIFIITGLVQAAPLALATVEGQDSAALVIDVPSIDGGVPDYFTLSSCVAMNQLPAHALPAGYTLADTPLGSSGPPGTTAWLLVANGAQANQWTIPSAGFGGHRGAAYAWEVVPPPVVPCDESHNCECDTAEGARTLGDLRLELLRETGYAAQSSRPPPGIVEMYNGFLDRAQKYIYSRYRSMQTERFFSWVLEEGVRYYGVRDSASCCDANLNRYRITGAWLEDLNGAWHPLRYGIDPMLYTMMTASNGYPQRFEVRQCIEIFPKPIQIAHDEFNPILPGMPAYRLWIRGHFGLRPFVDDAHYTTIEAEAVLLHAIGMAKRHKGMPDAEDYFTMADHHVRALIAGSHATRRYIPGVPDDVIWEGPPRPSPP